jgi:SAM-dependent methyltransferase
MTCDRSLRLTRLVATRCAICGTEGNSRLLYPANFDFDALNPVTFSARRLPDGIRFQIVACKTCGLVRSDPIVDPDEMARLYVASEFTYEREVANLRPTYGRHLSELLALGAGRDSLLEIGCGSGFLLQEALARGFADVRGVEPSAHAVALAHPDIRPRIILDIMRPGLFAPETFDVVCMFQVFDHIPDPGSLLDECWRVLKPGGVVLAVNHNVASLSARLLKERSPIVDIEHTYLYSPATMVQVFALHGFATVRVGAVRNRTSLRALARLAPIPVGKQRIVEGLERSAIGRLALPVPLGNLRLVARKTLRAPSRAAVADGTAIPRDLGRQVSDALNGHVAANGRSAAVDVRATTRATGTSQPAPDRSAATPASEPSRR